MREEEPYHYVEHPGYASRAFLFWGMLVLNDRESYVNLIGQVYSSVRFFPSLANGPEVIRAGISLI
jgi:hypothetical protein